MTDCCAEGERLEAAASTAEVTAHDAFRVYFVGFFDFTNAAADAALDTYLAADDTAASARRAYREHHATHGGE